MTQDEAIALADKRESTKSKHLSHKSWQAAHDSVKGWHVALADSGKPIDGTALAINISTDYAYANEDRLPDLPFPKGK